MRFGTNEAPLARRRLAKGKEQEWMADKMEITVTHYSRIERGLVKLTDARAAQIAKLLHLSTKEVKELQLRARVYTHQREGERIREAV